MTFGEKVRLARLAQKMSQRDLSIRSGISLRTINNYESDERMPKQRSSYTKLALALNIDEAALLDENAEFVVKASEDYGKRGYEQAMKIVEEVKGLYAGGELLDDDMDAMMQAIQDAYWIAKKKNRKYVPRKYRNSEPEQT